MKYNVHLYAVVRVKLDGVSATSQHRAMKSAISIAEPQLRGAFDNLNIRPFSQTEYAEEIVGFLVDESWDSDHAQSRFYDGKMKPQLRDQLLHAGDVRRQKVLKK